MKEVVFKQERKDFIMYGKYQKLEIAQMEARQSN